MFEPQERARVFATPLGVDLPRALVDGLVKRLAGQAPESWARVEIYVSTRRMQRRIQAILAEGPARLLPRIRTISDLGREVSFSDLPAPVSPLRRRLELTRLITALLTKQPDLAPRAALFDLADSLAGLMDEMQGEGVGPERLQKIDVANHSAYWARSLQFLEIVEHYFGETRAREPDAEARQRLVVEHLAKRWKAAPPAHPVIVAGSTGSRGATALFMQTVAQLPQGAVVLPGFDTDLPMPVWERLRDPIEGEDHPQFRFARLLETLKLTPADLPLWAPDLAPHNTARNRLVSLALRPAPVTDQWLSDGARISREMLEQACKDLTLIEAPSPRAEATAIALRLREAVEDGQVAALISPDRMLTRQVSAALARWDVEADDSAGQPLALSAPGRFLRHVAELFSHKLTATALLVLLKHPLTASGAARGDHLRFSRDRELEVLRAGLPFPTGDDLTGWSREKHAGDDERLAWATWLAGLIAGL
ncbi:MAG TPA: double-strand break repair protein AddB, partial [Aliiroseovarius sp.]|nr:double-strand break repair protein AddB [Aliiroseovarius sp.]